MNAYLGYWLASEVPEKKKTLNECWRLTKEALESFEETGDTSQYGRTYNQLSSSIVFEFPFEWDFQARKTMIKEAVEHGEQAIKIDRMVPRRVGNRHGLVTQSVVIRSLIAKLNSKSR